MKTKYVNTSTIEQFIELLTLMEKKGWKWESLDKPLFKNGRRWWEYEGGTCITIGDKFDYQSKEFYAEYLSDTHKEITYEEAIKLLTSTTMTTKTKFLLWLLGFILTGLFLGTSVWLPNETVWNNRTTTNTVQIK